MAIKPDSLKKRYFYKLFTNIIGFFLSIVIMGIIPRGLGPKSYGDFNFLTNFFNQIVGFLDMGTGQSFYTKISQRQEEKGLVTFYFNFVGLIALIIIGFVVVIHFFSFYSYILPDQKIFYIYLAAGIGFFTWLVNILNQMVDAYCLTVYAELSKLLQKGLGLIIIFVLYFFHFLNLKNFFYYQYFIVLFLCISFLSIMYKKGYYKRKNEKLTLVQNKRYVEEFYQYSYPLFVCSLIGLIAGIFDRWLLQVAGGSVQQGFFGLSSQIGAICFLFTGVMTPLLTREFSIAFGRKDLSEMTVLFERFIPMFYSITAYFSCFVVFQASKIIYIFGGKSYAGAIMPVIIMSFYPIYQSYGQLSGSVFFATNQTKLYTKINIIFLLLGIPTTYFLIAPHNRFGLNSGAVGLAIKVVLFAILVTNVMLYFNSKFLKLSFWKLFKQQIFSAGCLLLMAYFSTFIIDDLLGFRGKVIPGFLLAGVLYTLLFAGLVFFLPNIFGFKKQDFELFSKLGKKNNLE